MLRGVHYCGKSRFGAWHINNIDAKEGIDLQEIAHLLTKDKLKTVSHDEICWKGMDIDPSHYEMYRLNKRLENCDYTYPCILIKNCVNPKNLKYRMIDGKHRMFKMASQGITQSKFYILERNEIENYIKNYKLIKYKRK